MSRELLAEMEDALEGLLLCARWQLREGESHHPHLVGAVKRAIAALEKAAQHPREVAA